MVINKYANLGKDSLMLKTILDEFCNKYNYIGSMGYDKHTNEYKIVISKGNNNAGAFLTKDEMNMLNNNQLIDILDILHKGFCSRYD